MKRKINLFLVIASVVMLSVGCKKSSSSGTNNSNTSNSTNGNFTLKYEIILPSTLTNIADNTIANHVTFQNGTAQQETVNPAFTLGATTWTKVITVTTPNRPFLAQAFLTSIYLNSSGNVIGNIYVNGTQVAHTTTPTYQISGYNYNIGNCTLSYYIQ